MSASKKLATTLANAGGGGLNVEEVFSTYLYRGAWSNPSDVINGIDLLNEGGAVWVKARNLQKAGVIIDTERGATKYLETDRTDGNQTFSGGYGFDAFLDNGISSAANGYTSVNALYNYASWTFRKAPKFFDVVTYTGDGNTSQTINHNLGAVPGCIIIKSISNTDNWMVWHRSVSDYNASYASSGALNLTVKFGGYTGFSLNNTQTDSVFSVSGAPTNTSGESYVAYLFAHNDGDGEFGESGDQDIIKCGSVSYSGGATVDLGFEPQWVLMKTSSATGNWVINDVMRGAPNGSRGPRLDADNSNSELANATTIYPTSTGFIMPSGLYDPCDLIYIAIRRPMKTPESGTEVFASAYKTTNLPAFSSGFPVDMAIQSDISGGDHNVSDRLRGNTSVKSNSTAAESAQTYQKFDYMDGYFSWTVSYTSYFAHMFRRAPGFFDVVCYTGDTGSGASNRTYNHNLGVKPDMIIYKSRSTTRNWYVTLSGTYGNLNSSNAFYSDNTHDNAATNETTFYAMEDTAGVKYIAYLFASLPGISKVFSVTKSRGSDATVDCGFSSGARFVILKRTDSTGDWYVWDSERGIVAGNDPYLTLNSTGAQITTYDLIDPHPSGFTLPDNGLTGGVDDGDYIGYAIA
jgi:hypothetical protein